MFAVAGLGNTVYHPADYALLGRHVPFERAGRVFSYHTFAGMLGNAAAPATLVYLYAVVGWRGAFLVRRGARRRGRDRRVPDRRAGGAGQGRRQEDRTSRPNAD